MPDIVLTTLNASYSHCAFGLRYLKANLGPLRDRCAIVEFDTKRRPLDAVEAILAHEPRIVGVGVYVWNAQESRALVAALKRVRPDLRVVVGGPEVSHEWQEQEIVALCDHVVTGEADLVFADLCEALLRGEERPRVIHAEPPDCGAIALPYDLYGDSDIAHRVVYVEASRGCPFRCEFCLSALDVRVRQFPLDRFLAALDRLWQRGVRHFKFVDRTFNLSLATSRAILAFFAERQEPGMLLHFEMIPDRLPEALRAELARFPDGTVQLEVGIQTFDDATARRISRRQDPARIDDNLRFLRAHTGVHVHADLIVGLPGEDLATFARGFDRLCGLGPQEIQVGILKRLRGTPIVRHDREHAMVWSPDPPYEVLSTAAIDFATMQRLRRFARFLDLIADSGSFVETTRLVLAPPSPFARFMALSDWLYAQLGQAHGIALNRLAELVFSWLTEQAHVSGETAGRALGRDWARCQRPDWPLFLRPFAAPGDIPPRGAARAERGFAARQTRHRTRSESG
jgi:hypothetical protein